jgi:gas vesicle protein
MKKYLNNSLAKGVLWGALVGFTVAIFVAPRKGSASREAIKEYVDNLAGKIQKGATDRMASVQHTIDLTERDLERLIQQLRQGKGS